MSYAVISGRAVRDRRHSLAGATGGSFSGRRVGGGGSSNRPASVLELAPQPVKEQTWIIRPRTHADVWFDPNPSGEVATGRYRDIGLPAALIAQYEAELREREQPLKGRDEAWTHDYVTKLGMGEMPYLDCTPEIIAGGTGTACVNENSRRQQANFAEHDQGERTKHVNDCIRDFALNHGGSSSGNPCDSYTFGSTSVFAQPGFEDKPADVYARSTAASAYQYSPVAAPAAPVTPAKSPAAAAPAGANYVDTGKDKPAADKTAVDNVLDSLGVPASVSSAAKGLPGWAWAAAGVGAVLLMNRGGR